MKPVLSDRKSLCSVLPVSIEDYLRRAGWQELRRQDALASLWLLQDERSGKKLKVVVPLDQSLGDYASRVADLLRTLEAAEQRPAHEIFRTLKASESLSDAFEISIERDDIVEGLIPLTVGSRAFQGTRDIFLAAAASEHELRTASPSAPPLDAREALRHMFFSQTREGSYIISVVSRPPEPHLLAQGPEHGPWGHMRRVFERVAVALDAVRQATAEDTTEAFASRIELGVSWSLCRAVARLGSGKHFRKVSFTPRWARNLRPPANVPERIVFSPKMMRVVRIGAQTLKEIRPVQDFRLQGKVVELRRRGEHADEATIVVEGPIDATMVRRVSMELRGDAHRTAVEAYLTQEQVLCVGNLYMGAQTHRLVAVKLFERITGPTGEKR